MFHSSLEGLRSDDFLIQYGIVAGIPALRRLLRRSSEIGALRAAMSTGEVTDEELRAFVDTLVESWRPDQHFEFDDTLAGIAVAIEKRSTPFVEEFLGDLARVKRIEFHRSAAVAQATLGQRRDLIAGLKSITVCWKTTPIPPAGWVQVSVLPSSRGGQTERTITLGAT